MNNLGKLKRNFVCNDDPDICKARTDLEKWSIILRSKIEAKDISFDDDHVILRDIDQIRMMMKAKMETEN